MQQQRCLLLKGGTPIFVVLFFRKQKNASDALGQRYWRTTHEDIENGEDLQAESMRRIIMTVSNLASPLNSFQTVALQLSNPSEKIHAFIKKQMLLSHHFSTSFPKWILSKHHPSQTDTEHRTKCATTVDSKRPSQCVLQFSSIVTDDPPVQNKERDQQCESSGNSSKESKEDPRLLSTRRRSLCSMVDGCRHETPNDFIMHLMMCQFLSVLGLNPSIVSVNSRGP